MDQCCFREEEEMDEFFDSREELSSFFDSCPGSPASNFCSGPEENSVNLFASNPHYKVWIMSPVSIQQRRAMFMRWMGLDPGSADPVGELIVDDPISVDFLRSSSDSCSVLRGCAFENGSPVSSCSDEVPSTSENRPSEAQFEHRIKNLDDGRVFVSGDFRTDGTMSRVGEVGSNQMVTVDELERCFGPSSLVDSSSSSNYENVPSRRRVGWLRRFGAMACITDRHGYGFDSGMADSDVSGSTKFKRVRVRPYKKHSKEFSAVYVGQNFVAHRGAILTMKFSPDGEYLATGGEDGVVRVWQVMESQRTKEDVPLDNPSCMYFCVNYNLELSPLHVGRKIMNKSKGLRRTSDLACVVIPPKVFQISEKPFHEFHGHNGDILDLAWSKDKYLLSCSVDKAVRLWQLGFDKCLKVFLHNNYVTCIQFNPIDKRYFISGSIDGKARIWEISGCRVVDWTDIRQIITAACYRPDGKVVVVGSMMGDCRFYDASDNHLKLDAEVSFQRRNKSVDKRITGLQYSPSNNVQLMVTCADSVIRILDGFDVISKYKGLGNAGSQISAMFTSDGRHIVSASEDSNIYAWNHEHAPSSNHVKSNWSSERFASSHVSVAVPWHGFSSKTPPRFAERGIGCFTNFSLGHDFFSENPPKGSATWPEEELPSMGKFQLNFPKTGWQKKTSHAWGQVIVSAGLDGRIRSFQNYGLPVQL